MYMLSGIIGLGFIGTFVLVVVLLMLDFWTVRCQSAPPPFTYPRSVCYSHLVPPNKHHPVPNPPGHLRHLSATAEAPA